MPVRAIVFDLDGTLIDSAPVFTQILNAMLEDRGSRRRVTVADVRPFASLGGPALVGGILGNECGDLADEVADFRARYMRAPTPSASLYEGVFAGIERLSTRGHALAICSNKPQLLCEKIVVDLGLARCFTVIAGSVPGLRLKPAPDLLELVSTRLGIASDECIYVGDSEVDEALASVTGARFAFVTYGYATDATSVRGPDRFDRFGDLVDWIVAAPPARVAA